MPLGGDDLLLGDLEPVLVDLLVSLRPAMPLSLFRRRPGKPSLVSYLDIGVAFGSMETADLTGKTRSIEPGLRAALGPSYLCAPGDAGGSVLPVNIETGESRGSKLSRPGGRPWCWPSVLREESEEAEPFLEGLNDMLRLYHREECPKQRYFRYGLLMIRCRPAIVKPRSGGQVFFDTCAVTYGIQAGVSG